ncbi:MAG: glycoside hydrolase family 38 C-terminal domain-containing protein [Verrucomicrobiota bacterium]
MLPSHSLPQLIPNRVQAAIFRLQESLWFDHQQLKVEATKGSSCSHTLSQAMKLPRKLIHEGSFWGKLFDQRWCRILLPKRQGEWWMNWRDQGEATLYVKGEPYFGFDVGHRYCRIPEGVQEVWVESNCVQSAIWHPEANGMDEKGSYYEGASLCRRNDEAWHAFHDLKCLFDLAMDQRHRENPKAPTTLHAAGLQTPVDQVTPFYRQLLYAMDEAVDAYDLQGIVQLRHRLAEAYQAFRMDKSFMRCVLTGHAHLDLVWLWPERIGEMKAVHIFSTMERLMEEYPEYRFAYSQTASYEAVKRRAPSLYEKVCRRIQSGQWQATGAMYVESDTIFACGEALARGFTLGQTGFTEINGKPAKLTWLPDVFGYSACLPQIMKQTGVEYFFTTKMTWNAINRFPYSSFIWRGNDGSEVVAHVTQESGYVTHMEIDNIKAPMLAHQQGDVHREYLLPTGYGDGGGGPTHEMIERARRLGSLPGMPAMNWGQPEAFFERMMKRREKLPVHQGECYLEYHRGTFTTHGNLKSIFRSLERAMQMVEAASSISGKQMDLEHAWKRLVFAQFHDYIPGSSVWDVYREGLPELKKMADEQIVKAQKSLTSKNGSEAFFNPHAVTVHRWIQDSETKKAIYVSLPPLSGVSLKVISPSKSPDEVRISGRTISNGLTEFRMNAAGWIDRLVWEGVSVPIKSPLGTLEIYPDRAANFEAWDIDRQALSLGQVCDEKPVITILNKESHRAGFSVKRKIGKKSEATVTYVLESGSPLVHLHVALDWQEPECLLKMHFPTRYSATNARFGIPFGSVLRSQVNNGMLSEAMWEVPFSRHLEVFDEGEREGLFLVTEAKYGASVRNGEIGVSLVRSPRVTGMEAHRHAWPKYLSRLKGLSTYSDIGKHSIKLAIGRYDMGLERERQPAMVAETLFTAPLRYQGKSWSSPIQSLHGGETLLPCWTIPLDEKSFALRFHEVSGQRGSVRVESAKGWKFALAHLDGDPVTQLNFCGNIGYDPYQILTLVFRR